MQKMLKIPQTVEEVSFPKQTVSTFYLFIYLFSFASYKNTKQNTYKIQKLGHHNSLNANYSGPLFISYFDLILLYDNINVAILACFGPRYFLSERERSL